MTGSSWLAFSPDGSKLAVGYEASLEDKTAFTDPRETISGSKLRVWRTSDWALLRDVTLTKDVGALAWAPDNHTLAVAADYGGEVQFYQLP